MNFAAGEWVRLTDAKGRRHNFALTSSKEFHTKKGIIAHDDIIGKPDGSVVVSTMGYPYQVFRPLLHESLVSMPRGAAIVYPKDAASIVVWADIFPGARVLEAGAGSGSLTSYLLRAVGAHGAVYSYEQRGEFAKNAQYNVERYHHGTPHNWTLTIGDVADATETDLGRVILDLVNPWDYVDLAADRLIAGGVLCAYVATTTQLSKFVETVRAKNAFTEPRAWENLQREWHVEGLAVRPAHGAGGHTAFLAMARRMAPGTTPLAKSRRPARGAYGPDYTGPRPPGLA